LVGAIKSRSHAGPPPVVLAPVNFLLALPSCNLPPATPPRPNMGGFLFTFSSLAGYNCFEKFDISHPLTSLPPSSFSCGNLAAGAVLAICLKSGSEACNEVS